MQRARVVALFLITTLVMVLPALMLIFTREKLLLHAWLNSRHGPVGDHFFSYATHLADGWVPLVLSLVLLFIKDLRSFLMMALSTGLSAVITQFLKRMVFGEWDRPFMFQEELGDMAWVLGLDLHHHFSFPSGHATAAFSMCMALAVISGRSRLAVPFAVLAAVLAFSRVYLSQHFLEDIAAGSLIGTATATLVYMALYKGPRAQDVRLDRRPLRRQK
jgi:membrane-associated phospholipid phosphatase